MKKAIAFLLIACGLLYWAKVSFAIWPFDGDKLKTPVCKPQPKPVICNYAIAYHEDERKRKVYMIFSAKALGKCGKMSHTGVLDEIRHYYERYRDLNKIRWGSYEGANGHREVVAEWGELNLVEVYEGPTTPQEAE